MNCAYYSAVGNDDRAYLLARAIQFFTPGIPLVYYVGLLAGANDIDLVESTKVGRDINRHAFSEEEAAGELERPVVQVWFRLQLLSLRCPCALAMFPLYSAACCSERCCPSRRHAMCARTGNFWATSHVCVNRCERGMCDACTCGRCKTRQA